MSSRVNPSQFSDGEPVSKSALRDTFSTIKSELEHGGFTQIAPDAPMRRLSEKLDDMISVKDFGAKGDNVADDTAAFQAAIDSGRAIHVPSGRYRVSPLKWDAVNKSLVLIGEHSEFGAASSVIQAINSTTDEPIIGRVEGWMKADGTFTVDGTTPYTVLHPSGRAVILKNIRFGTGSGAINGQCVEIHNARSCYIENCRFEFTMRGLTLGQSVFDSNIINCGFVSSFFVRNPGAWDTVRDVSLRSWGLAAQGHTYIYGAMCMGAGTGLYLSGVGANLIGGRMEQCGHGVVLGYGRYLPTTTGLQPEGLLRSIVTGISLEANAVGLLARSIGSTTISAIGAQGSLAEGTSRTYDSESGFVFEGVGRDCTIQDIATISRFTRAGIVNNSRKAIANSFASNITTTGAIVAAQNTPLLTGPDGTNSEPYYHFLNTEMFPSAVKSRHKTITAFHDFMLPGLTGVNIKDKAASGTAEGGPVFAKNLGGTVTPANAVSTASVTFATTLQAGNIAFSGNPVVTAGAVSALEAGTYFYATTVVAPHGETSAPANLTAVVKEVVVSTGGSVTLSFFGTSQNVKRRIYRGRKSGQYEGYWEQNGHASFTDDGAQAFDGRGGPPIAGNIPSRAEDDANYQIVATPSWATTVHVTDKATTGFTLNFGTPAPDANQTVAWLMFRP